jgi:hypothetical protein
MPLFIAIRARPKARQHDPSARILAGSSRHTDTQTGPCLQKRRFQAQDCLAGYPALLSRRLLRGFTNRYLPGWWIRRVGLL